MIRWRLDTLFKLTLGLAALVALAAFAPEPAALRSSLWLTFAAFLALAWGTVGAEGPSVAPTLTVMAYLTLGHGVSAALWATAVGALVASAARWLASAARGKTGPGGDVLSTAASLGHTVLAMLAAHAVYLSLDGRAPLIRVTADDWPALAGLGAAFLGACLTIGALATIPSDSRRRTLSTPANFAAGSATLLSLPSAVVGSVVYHNLSDGIFALLLVSLLALAASASRLNTSLARALRRAGEREAAAPFSSPAAISPTPDAALDMVYEQLQKALSARNLTVALVGGDGQTLTFPLYVVNGTRQTLRPQRMGTGLLEHVIHQGRPLLLPDRVEQRARTLGLAPPPRSVRAWMGVPLVGGGRTLGAVAVFSTSQEPTYSLDDVRLLAAVASDAARAIDRAPSQEAQQRTIQFATLNNVIGVLSGTLDMQQVLDLVMSSALAVGAADGVILYLWQDEGNGGAPDLVRQTGLGAAAHTEPPAPVMLEYDLDDLARRRQPLIVADVNYDQRARSIRAAAYQAGKRGWAEFLLRKADDLLGILVFLYDQPRQFAPEEVELLRNYTSQAALAISNARLYTQTDAALQRRVEQLSALSDISRELTSTLNLSRLFQVVLDRALEATDSQTGALLLTEKADAAPVLVAARGFAADEHDRAPLLGRVAAAYRTGKPVVVQDIRSEPNVIPLSARTRSQMLVPIARGEDVLGVIALGSERPGSYSADDRSFVTQLATQARIAIDNARLFQRIEIARDRLQVILDSMAEGVILLATNGRIALANPRVERLLGLPPAAITGQTVDALLHDPSLGLAERLGFTPDSLFELVEALQAGEWDSVAAPEHRLTFDVTAASKSRVIERSAAPVRDNAGRTAGLLLVFHDVTEERALAQVREDLSSMIVHDLRGPLTAINTSLMLLHEIAQEDDRLGAMITPTTAQSGRAVRKLLNQVDSLLDISKMESGAMKLDREPVSLESLSTRVIEELRPLADELDVALHVEIPTSVPLLDVDTDKAERILLNLMDNAIKYTPAGGSVRIEALPLEAAAANQTFVQVNVRDTGPGIPDEFKQRLFERFVQLEGQRGRRRGTGLGLAFCKMAVEAHGGRIWVEDNPPGGAVVAFTFPAARLQAEEERE